MASRTFEFNFPASLHYLTALRNAVQAFCADTLGPDATEEQIYQLQLAVSELATNIVVHAAPGFPDGIIEVAGEGSDRTITLDFYDRGAEYQAKEPTLPDPDSLAEGGYGSFIIQQCVDTVSYVRESDGRNHWRLVKAFGDRGGN
jgi:anti-sigma regulatory factor (Ser/Thr protein kinase)